MKRKIAMLAFSSVIAAGSVAALRLSTDLERSAPSLGSQRDRAARIERGDYLVRTSGCHDCHTPWKLGPNGPEPDMDLMLSGHPAELELPAPPEAVGPWLWHGAATNTAFAGPWGISYTANLTSDELTGIGAWTEDIFVRAIRTGRHWGQSRQILPPMPWQVYGQMTDEDLGAIFAYLKSVPPIRNQVPEPIIARENAGP
jgi:hypothetical protein